MTRRSSFSVLLLNQYFPPDASATANMALLVAEALGERARVTVLAGRPSYDPSERHRYYVRNREPRGGGGNRKARRLGRRLGAPSSVGAAPSQARHRARR